MDVSQTTSAAVIKSDINSLTHSSNLVSLKNSCKINPQQNFMSQISRSQNNTYVSDTKTSLLGITVIIRYEFPFYKPLESQAKASDFTPSVQLDREAQCSSLINHSDRYYSSRSYISVICSAIGLISNPIPASKLRSTRTLQYLPITRYLNSVWIGIHSILPLSSVSSLQSWQGR